MGNSTLPVGRTKRTDTWSARLARHAVSGLSVTAFCANESVSSASFYRWRTHLDGRTGADAAIGMATTAAFIELGAMEAAHGRGASAQAVSGVASPCAAIEVHLDLGHGVILHIVRR